MSVIHFSDQELAGLWYALDGEPELQYPIHANVRRAGPRARISHAEPQR
jgi:hypothetical protein